MLGIVTFTVTSFLTTTYQIYGLERRAQLASWHIVTVTVKAVPESRIDIDSWQVCVLGLNTMTMKLEFLIKL